MVEKNSFASDFITSATRGRDAEAGVLGVEPDDGTGASLQPAMTTARVSAGPVKILLMNYVRYTERLVIPATIYKDDCTTAIKSVPVKPERYNRNGAILNVPLISPASAVSPSWQPQRRVFRQSPDNDTNNLPAALPRCRGPEKRNSI